MDCSLPGSSIHGIFQARVLEWGAIAFSTRLYDELYIKTDFKPVLINTVWYGGRKTNGIKYWAPKQVYTYMESWYEAYLTFQINVGKNGLSTKCCREYW